MTKKIILILLLVVVAAVAVVSYSKHPGGAPSKISVAEQNKAQYEKLNAGKKPYAMIDRETVPKNQMLGKILAVDQSEIAVEKVLDLECFSGFNGDYGSESVTSLSEKELDAKYNAENLPWCTSWSGGSGLFFSDTGEGFTYGFDADTAFLVQERADASGTAVTKEAFLKNVDAGHAQALITTDGSTARTVELQYGK